jgi:predicted HTH transcriptional regulator
MVITPAQLKKLIDSDEALKIDRKEMFEIKNDHQKKEFAKDVSAIANTPGPRGFLLYGITNDKKVKGISRSDFKEDCRNLYASRSGICTFGLIPIFRFI